MIAPLLLACVPVEEGLEDLDPTSIALPDPADLPEVVEPPDVLQMWSEDLAIEDEQGWWRRRAPELQLLFSHYVYGRPGLQGEPFALPAVAVVAEEPPIPVHDGRVLLRRLHAEADGLPFEIDLFLPPGEAGPFPVVVGLNKCGLHSLIPEATVPLPTAFVQSDCEGGATDAGRGTRASYWDLVACAEAGVAVATVHQSEFAPDDPDLPAPIDVLAGSSDDLAARWGAIGWWATGLRLTAAALRERSDLDPQRMVVFGHSRRGKAALWAGANDADIPIVWAHQSGTGGATLSRSMGGEPVATVNFLFPHWFADHFAAFGDRETHLPMDQHGLLALIAPRPLWISDGTDDLWADPDGAEESIVAATPVFDLLGATPPTHHLRPGGHEVRSEDWAWILGQLATSGSER
ncbi:MAG: hypothetical protein KC621_22045 [Myxococcales bacterium]|nr:hypothetical protein [Myxococcales bacterium]